MPPTNRDLNPTILSPFKKTVSKYALNISPDLDVISNCVLIFGYKYTSSPSEFWHRIFVIPLFEYSENRTGT
jgi:hypothetical protein